jgi:pseudouridine-5'-phosphate glycosidase
MTRQMICGSYVTKKERMLTKAEAKAVKELIESKKLAPFHETMMKAIMDRHLKANISTSDRQIAAEIYKQYEAIL